MKKGTILITGASSGIGRAFALKLAAQGFSLLITGRNKDKLEELVDDLRSMHHIHADYLIAELSDEKQVTSVIREIENREDIIGLINNAGFGCGRKFSEHTIEGHLQMLKVHILVTIRLIHAVLPQMIRRRAGFIINVSSLGAFIPAPGNSIYAASKLFLKSFSESLSMEVRRYGLKVQCLCPGLTHTEFHQRRTTGNNTPNDHRILWMEPDQVVEKSLRSLNKPCVICIPGLLNRIVAIACSLIPRNLYYLIMNRPGKSDLSQGPLIEKKKLQLFENKDLLIIKTL